MEGGATLTLSNARVVFGKHMQNWKKIGCREETRGSFRMKSGVSFWQLDRPKDTGTQHQSDPASTDPPDSMIKPHCVFQLLA
jgi:hypothetical protein